MQVIAQELHSIVSLAKNEQMYIPVNFQFFNFARIFFKNDATQFAVLENLMLFVVKRFLPMRIGESMWLHTYYSTKNYSDICGDCIGQLLISHMHI
jgi:hypothetical protein